MSLSTSPSNVLNTLARSLVAKQAYPSVEEALRELALTAVRSKIAYYQRRIRSMERKHGTSFDKFSLRLKGRATPAQEDDWLAWRSAQRMLADWHKTYRDLLNGGTR